MRKHRLLGVLGHGVHQHQRVDSAGHTGNDVGGGRAFVGSARRAIPRSPLFGMGAFEGKDRAPVRTAVGFPGYGISVQRVITKKRIRAVEVSLGGMDRFRTADFFGRFAEELERATDVVRFHGRLGGEDAAKGADAEHGMRVGVAGSPGVQAVARGLIGHGLLRVAGNGVVFGIGTDHRPVTIGPGRGEGGGHAAGTLLDIPAIGTQQIDIGPGRLVFTPGGLGVAPDFEIEVGKPLAILVDPVDCRLLCRVHRRACHWFRCPH